MKAKVSILFFIASYIYLSHSSAQSLQIVNTDPKDLSNGRDNTIIGHSAGNTLLSINPAKNVIIGKEAGNSITDGASNVLIGNSAGRMLTTGTNNILLGLSAGWENKSGSHNTILGLFGCENCNDNVIIGRRGGNTIPMHNNVILGPGNMTINKGAMWSQNVIIGYMAADKINSSLSGSVIIGNGTARFAEKGGIFIGNSAGYFNQGVATISIGSDAGHSNARSNNIFLGHGAGSSSNMANSIVIGNDAMEPQIGNLISKSEEGVFIGNGSAQLDEQSRGSVYLGYWAGRDFKGGSGNIFIGDKTAIGRKKTGSSYSESIGDGNVFIGQSSAAQIEDMSANVFIGRRTGTALKLGKGNVFLGSEAGSDEIRQVNDVILLGRNTQAKNNLNNAIALGTNAKVIEDNTVVVAPGLNVGIGTDSPKAKLEIMANAASTSGLKFTNLTQNDAAVQAKAKVLTVDESGYVILMELPSGTIVSVTELEIVANKCLEIEQQNQALADRITVLENEINSGRNSKKRSR